MSEKEDGKLNRGKEKNIISPLSFGDFVTSSDAETLKRGYAKIDAENLVEKTRADRRNPREKLSYFAPSDIPMSRQEGIKVKENLYG